MWFGWYNWTKSETTIEKASECAPVTCGAPVEWPRTALRWRQHLHGQFSKRQLMAHCRILSGASSLYVSLLQVCYWRLLRPLGFAPSSAAALRPRPPRKAPLAPHPLQGLCFYSRLQIATIMYRCHDTSVLARMERGQNTTSLPSSRPQKGPNGFLSRQLKPTEVSQTSLASSRLCLDFSVSNCCACSILSAAHVELINSCKCLHGNCHAM